MHFTFAQYEVMYGNNEGWKDVSEKTAIDKVSDCYDRVSPVLLDLFQGKVIITPDAIFRIKNSSVPG